MTNKLFIVGRVHDDGHDRFGVLRWEFMGVFDSREKAEAACTLWEDFVGPCILNQRLSDDVSTWPGAYYPLSERDDGRLVS